MPLETDSAGWNFVVRGQSHALQDGSRCRIDHDQPLGQTGRHEPLAVGTQRERIRPHAGKFDQDSGGRDELIDRRFKAVGAVTDGFGCRVEIFRV